ncbi:DUF6968 family protein [Leptospira santarosai]|uniref:DUF6968 family protein n=1 Tax=Leptospira santarosai TaxID=28183 RepID=UPI0002FBAD4B|nr:hypothetical protein [Leptospira santarosai]MDI7182678.1 hypothetical protein [Leptospira santarosai]
MKQQYKLGTVIAERKLSLKVGRKKQTVLIRIGKPKISNDPKMDWYCPFQISKIGLDTIKAAHGIDSIQALLLAMKMIEAILVHFQKSNPGKLTWLNQEYLGFPLPETLETNLRKERVWRKTFKKKSVSAKRTDKK